MKIVEIIPQLSSGGAERFTVDLCNEFAAQGHEVLLVTLYKVRADDTLGFYLPELSPNVMLHELHKAPGFDFKLMYKLYQLIRQFKPDVVHSHLRSLPYIFPSSLVSRRIKFFHTIHNDAQKEASDIINRISRKISFKCQFCHPVTISNESDQSFDIYYGQDVSHTLIPNGSPDKISNSINAPEVLEAKAKGKIVIVNIARINPQKNQLELIEAIRNYPEIELLIIGNDSESYAELVKTKAPENVKILGQRANPRDYMKAADAFILSSIYEGMPITLIECFSVGAIPIVTPVGGIVNMVTNNLNGILMEGSTEKDISNAIYRYIQMSDEKKRLIQENSRKSFFNYSMVMCANKYISLFNS